jgi:hypothetical protein
VSSEVWIGRDEWNVSAPEGGSNPCGGTAKMFAANDCGRRLLRNVLLLHHHQLFPALTEANRPTSLHAKAVTRAAAKVRPARLDNFKRLEFHDLRHTFASLMNRGGRESRRVRKFGRVGDRLAFSRGRLSEHRRVGSGTFDVGVRDVLFARARAYIS